MYTSQWLVDKIIIYIIYCTIYLLKNKVYHTNNALSEKKENIWHHTKNLCVSVSLCVCRDRETKRERVHMKKKIIYNR